MQCFQPCSDMPGHTRNGYIATFNQSFNFDLSGFSFKKLKPLTIPTIHVDFTMLSVEAGVKLRTNFLLTIGME